jgi:hypothetical protein
MPRLHVLLEAPRVITQLERYVGLLSETTRQFHDDVTWQVRRESGNASRNTSSPVSAHSNVDLVASIGAGPLRRITSEYRGNSRQPLRTMLGYGDGSGSPSTLSSPSRSAGRVYEHADLPSRRFSSWQGENRQNNEQGTVAPPGSPRTRRSAAQHGEAGATAGGAAEIGQRARESPALLRPVKTGHLTYRVPGESQVEDISGTAARTRRQPLGSASDARATIGEGQNSQNSVLKFLSGLGRARTQGDNNDRRRPSLQSVDTSLDSSDGTQRVQSSHTQLQTRAESQSSLGAPISSRPSSPSSHISLASSIETIRSTLSFYVDLTQAETSEEPETSSTPPPFFAPSSLAEDIVYGPSTLSQDDLNEGDREEDVPSGEQRRASSSQLGNLESARGILSPVEHMHSHFDPNTGDDTLSPFPQPLSPLMVASAFPTPAHFWTQNIRQSPTNAAASSPREVWPTSPPSHFSFELERSPSTASGLGLLTGVASPHRHPLPQSPAAQTFPESPVDRSVRSTDAPQQSHATSPHLGPATPEDTQSVRTRLVDCGSNSHHNVPLPPSPFSTASNSFTRLQFQPAHRHSPRTPMYPSLAGEDPEFLSPSGLGVVFGLPTPGLSPIQAPALIRSPAMDPRSPVPSRMRIPGDILGLLRAFLHSGHDHAHASFILFQDRLFWSSYASHKKYAKVSLITRTNVDLVEEAPAYGVHRALCYSIVDH